MEKLIYKKMADIQNEIEAVYKSKSMKNQNGQVVWTFRGIEQVLDEVAPAMRKHRVFIAPKIYDKIYERLRVEKKNSSGATIGERYDTYCQINISYTFYAEDGSFVEIGPICAESMDNSDKSTTKALSVAYRMTMIQAFSIPVNDLPDIEDDDLKNQNRDMPEISKPTKESVEKKEEIIAKIIKEFSDITKGMDKDAKGKFFTEKTNLKSFKEISKLEVDELNKLLNKLITEGIKF